LDATGVHDGDAVTAACNGSAGQQWYIPTDGPIVNVANTQLCLDVFQKEFSIGTPLKFWDCNGGSNQTFFHDQAHGQIAPRAAAQFCLTTATTGTSAPPISLGSCRPVQPGNTWTVSPVRP
jgi:hypothetical protein